MSSIDYTVHPEIIYFVEKDCGPDWKFQTNHIHFYSLTFVQAGSADYDIDAQHYAAGEGDVIFIKPGSLRYAKTTGMSCVAIDFILPPDQQLDLPSIMRRGSLEQFRRLFLDLKFNWLEKREGYKLKCQAIFMLVLHELLYELSGEHKNIHVENMKHFIMKNYMQSLSVAMVARHVNLSRVYCGALFKKIEGQTIASFINHVRINQAIHLLETGKSISETAAETGFTDIYYFSTTFKRIVGTNPSTYKKRSFIARF